MPRLPQHLNLPPSDLVTIQGSLFDEKNHSSLSLISLIEKRQIDIISVRLSLLSSHIFRLDPL